MSSERAIPAGGHPPTPNMYRSICDGSSAVALDDLHFAVADDDKNVLRIFRIGEENAVGKVDLDDFLDTPLKEKAEADGEPKHEEADIEASARIGRLVYWICSHGRDSKGRPAPGRDRFFATRIIDVQKKSGARYPSLEPVGAPFRELREALFADPKLALFGLAEAYAKGGEEAASNLANGFNIEGLAADRKGRLLIGFRNPRPKGLALLVRLKNPGELVNGSTKPKFGKPVLLDLGGLGVRSIERVGKSFLIVAGPSGEGSPDSPASFRIYLWSGKRRDEPEELTSLDLPHGFRAEALFAIAERDKIALLSDDGDVTDASDRRCKDRKRKDRSFRALVLPAPEFR